MSNIIEAYQAWRLRRAIASVRREFAWWGFPLDNMSDEEIIAGAYWITDAARQSGVTATEAASAFRLLGEHLN